MTEVQGIHEALGRMRLDYVDLLLIHWPVPSRDTYVGMWRTFERIWAEGFARAIGVSNFKVPHLQRLIDATGVVPAVNQLQISPMVPRSDERAFHEAHGIITSAYSPLGGMRGAPGLLAQPSVVDIARRLGRTPAQVVLRWHVQQGIIPLPKSADGQRMAENADVFSFELTSGDMRALNTVPPGVAVDSDDPRHGR